MAGELGLDYHSNILTPLRSGCSDDRPSNGMMVCSYSPCPYYLSNGSVGDLHSKALAGLSVKLLKVIQHKTVGVKVRKHIGVVKLPGIKNPTRIPQSTNMGTGNEFAKVAIAIEKRKYGKCAAKGRNF